MKTKNIIRGLVVLLTLNLTLWDDAFGQPPPWAPAHGYRAKVRYIYFPDYNFYFDLQRGVYIYMSGDIWQIGIALPVMYTRIDLGGAAKVQLELNTDSPQQYNADHIIKYKVQNKGQPDKIKLRPGHGNGHGKGKKK